MPTIRRFYTLPAYYACTHRDRVAPDTLVEVSTVASPRRSVDGSKFVATETHPGGRRYLLSRGEAAFALRLARRYGAIARRVSFPIPD